MVRWLRWHCPPDTGLEIRALAIWGRARYLSVTEAPHNTNNRVSSGRDCVTTRVTLSAVDVTVLLPVSPFPEWTCICYCQGHRVSSVGDCVITSSECWCLIGRVTPSAVYVVLAGHPVTSGSDCVITRVTLSAVDVTVLLSGSSCQQCRWLCYSQGHPVSSECDCVIVSVTLSAVNVTVLLSGSPCQQWMWLCYCQDHPVSSGCDCVIVRFIVSAV